MPGVQSTALPCLPPVCPRLWRGNTHLDSHTPKGPTTHLHCINKGISIRRRNGDSDMIALRHPSLGKRGKCACKTTPITCPQLCKPKMEACRPKMEACRPKMEACRPKMEVCRPKMEACRPKMEACRPKMEACRPKMEVCRPKMEACRPKMEAKMAPPSPEHSPTSSYLVGIHDNLKNVPFLEKLYTLFQSRTVSRER